MLLLLEWVFENGCFRKRAGRLFIYLIYFSLNQSPPTSVAILEVSGPTLINYEIIY